jgi:hypothetical protein
MRIVRTVSYRIIFNILNLDDKSSRQHETADEKVGRHHYLKQGSVGPCY